MNTLLKIDWSIVLPIATVMITGLVALLVEMLRPKQNNNVIVGVSLTGLALAFILLVQQLGLIPKSTLSGTLYRDQFGVLIQLILLAGAAITFLFSEGYLRNKRMAYGEFYPLAIWSLGGAMVMVATENLIVMFVGLEVLSISLYCLSCMARDEQRSEEAALKYFLLGAFASAFLLYGISYLYGASGRVDLYAFEIAYTRSTSSNMAAFAFALMLVGLGFKAALVPFHQWTPDVYQGAPTNVTAFMSVISKAAAFAALARLLDAASGLQTIWLPALTFIAIATMTVGNVAALAQRDVKRVLGYSSIAHAGYILVALLAHVKRPDLISLGNVVFYLVCYSAMTIGAFAMITITARNGKEGTRNQDLNGMWKKAPYAAGVLFLCLISLIGIPPTAGFFGKWAIFSAALQANLPILAVALAINSVVSAFYYWQIIKSAFIDDDAILQTDFAPVNGGLKLTGIICAAAILTTGFGFFANPLLFAAESSGRDFVQFNKQLLNQNNR
jgi:NADH-quinone oxidoreductase subunit N